MMTQLMWQRRASVCQRLPFRGGEIDVDRGAGGVVRIKHGLHRSLADELAVDASDNPVAGHVGEHFVFELRRICSAFADQVAIKPLLSDALELPEQVEFRIFAGVAPFVQDEVGTSAHTTPARDARLRYAPA